MLQANGSATVAAWRRFVCRCCARDASNSAVQPLHLPLVLSTHLKCWESSAKLCSGAGAMAPCPCCALISSFEVVDRGTHAGHQLVLETMGPVFFDHKPFKQASSPFWSLIALSYRGKGGLLTGMPHKALSVQLG